MAVNAKSAKVQVKITFICRINIWQESSTKCNGTIQKWLKQKLVILA